MYKRQLPQNVLSAVVMVALINLFDFKRFLWYLKNDVKDAAIWFATFNGVLFSGVEWGILIGFCTSFFFIMIETVLGPLPELGVVSQGDDKASIYLPLRQYPSAVRLPDIVIFKPQVPLFFGNVARFAHSIVEATKAAAASKIVGVIIDFSGVQYVDTTFVEVCT